MRGSTISNSDNSGKREPTSRQLQLSNGASRRCMKNVKAKKEASIPRVKYEKTQRGCTSNMSKRCLDEKNTTSDNGSNCKGNVRQEDLAKPEFVLHGKKKEKRDISMRCIASRVLIQLFFLHRQQLEAEAQRQTAIYSRWRTGARD